MLSTRFASQSWARRLTVRATVTPLFLAADVRLRDDSVTRTMASTAMMGRDIASIPAIKRVLNRFREDRQRSSSRVIMSVPFLHADRAGFQPIGEVGEVA